MGNAATSPAVCSNAQNCVDELVRAQAESADFDCDPAGTVFNETLQGLPRVDQEALRFAGTSNLSAVRWLLAMGARAGARDKKGTTMMHAACRGGSGLIVKVLVRNGYPLDIADSAGWTPLHVTAVMGRRNIAVLLLRARANATATNKKGATALDLCRDPATRDVLQGFCQLQGDHKDKSQALAGLLVATSDVYAVGECAPSCEPFFVPRAPLFRDAVHRAELIELGTEIFNKNAGHGLAFCVATGVVHDRPTDLSVFLLENEMNPTQLGEFLGEELSIAETLRLAFIDSVDLRETGVAGALRKAFEFMRAPRDLTKIDRLTSAVAHMWWRAHDTDADDEEAEEADFCGLVDGDVPCETQHFESGDALRCEEAQGAQLRMHVRSVEGLQRLMFSTIMLIWNFYGGAIFSSKVSSEHLSFTGWLDLNSGIEVDGSDIPVWVQEGVYRAVTGDPTSVNLLPPEEAPDQQFDASSISSTEPPERGSGLGIHAWAQGLTAQDSHPRVQGWATIPKGGLERHDALPTAAYMPGSPPLAHCILSENSATSMAIPGGEPKLLMGVSVAADDEGEAVWLSLRFSSLLLLSTGPGRAAPYAFVRLRDATIREVDRFSRHIILAGRPKTWGRPVEKNCRGIHSPIDDDMETEMETESGGDQSPPSFGPFGETPRLPLVLCFLLPDGRFQSFKALWLELIFKTDVDLEMWARELDSACQVQQLELKAASHSGPTTLVGPINLSPAPKMPEPSTPPSESGGAGHGPDSGAAVLELCELGTAEVNWRKI